MKFHFLGKETSLSSNFNQFFLTFDFKETSQFRRKNSLSQLFTRVFTWNYSLVRKVFDKNTNFHCFYYFSPKKDHPLFTTFPNITIHFFHHFALRSFFTQQRQHLQLEISACWHRLLVRTKVTNLANCWPQFPVSPPRYSDLVQRLFQLRPNDPQQPFLAALISTRERR